ILVIANLSRFVQYVGLDLAAFKGTAPVELFGRAQFPQITETPYFLTLGPHSFYWFLLTPVGAVREAQARQPPAVIEGRAGAHRAPLQLMVPREWTNVFSGRARARLEQQLTPYMQTQRWFRGKARQIKSASFLDIIPFSFDSTDVSITQVLIEYDEDEP